MRKIGRSNRTIPMTAKQAKVDRCELPSPLEADQFHWGQNERKPEQWLVLEPNLKRNNRALTTGTSGRSDALQRRQE